MKPFRFPLQRVLDVKLTFERQQQLTVAAAERELAAAQAALDDVMHAHAAAVAAGNDGAVTANPMLRAINWRGRARLLEQVQRRTETTHERTVARDEARTLLVERHQERRSLELLAEKQRGQHRLEQLRREQKLVDDLTGARVGRMKRGADGE